MRKAFNMVTTPDFLVGVRFLQSFSSGQIYSSSITGATPDWNPDFLHLHTLVASARAEEKLHLPPNHLLLPSLATPFLLYIFDFMLIAILSRNLSTSKQDSSFSRKFFESKRMPHLVGFEQEIHS